MNPAAADYERLVDPRFGIVLGLVRKKPEPAEPAGLVSYHGRVNDSRRLGQWYGDRISLGMAFHDPEAARRAAIGEAVERYCGNFIPRDLRRASFGELVGAGEAALDPEDLALYSPRQYATPGFPFRPFHRDLRVWWCRGREMASGTDAWVPASLVYVNFFVDTLAHEPRVHFVNLAGLAAGVGREDAERSALEEVLERDAVTVWWLSASPAVTLDGSGDRHLAADLVPVDPRAPGLDFRFLAIRNAFGVPVVAVVVRDPENRILALGAACRPDPRTAAKKALAEAVHLRGYARELLSPGGRVWRMMAEGLLDRRVYKPYREDRTYADAYRADFRDVVDLGCHSQIFLDPRMQERAEPALRSTAGTRPLESLPSLSAEERSDLRSAYLARLGRRNLRAYSVEVTTPDVAAAGLSVVRVVVPGLYGNAPAAFPPLGGQRLYRDPVELGWRPGPLDEDGVRLLPIPHT